jgi:glycosyltransferase involved in cell wall biosynthesis
MKISAVVLTKNNEAIIGSCLKSLEFCDEIIVIDDFSSDTTTKIANKYSTKVIERNLSGDFANQRNFGLSMVNFDWVLFIDSDEVVSKELSKEIVKAVRNTKYNGFKISRKDVFMGKTLKYGEAGNAKLLRLARKSKGHWKRSVHEVWVIEGAVGEIKSKLLHYAHPRINEFCLKISILISITCG